MRRIWIGAGLIATLCAFCTAAAPALAVSHKKTHTKPPKVLGKFVANYPSGKKINETNKAFDKGIGSVEVLKLADGAINVVSCKKVKSAGGINWERSDTIFQLVSFDGCRAKSYFGESPFTEVLKIPNFKIGFEFHSNGFVETGGGESTSVHVDKTSVIIKGPKGSQCEVELPAQTLPVKATKKPENEFEAATYETEEHPAKIKKFPAGFQEELDIYTELKKVVANVKKLTPSCVDKSPGKYKNNTGEIEIELEEVRIKNGNLGFRDKAEVEAEEKAAREASEKAEKAGKEENPEEEKAKTEAAEKAEKEKVEAEEQQEKEKAEKVEKEEKEKQEKEQEEIEAREAGEA